MAAKAKEKKLNEELTTKPLPAKRSKSTIVEKVENAIKSIDNFLATGCIERYIWGLIKSLTILVSGAIVFVVLASIAPELREQMPSVYLFVDWLLRIFEWIARLLCNFLHLC